MRECLHRGAEPAWKAVNAQLGSRMIAVVRCLFQCTTRGLQCMCVEDLCLVVVAEGSAYVVVRAGRSRLPQTRPRRLTTRACCWPLPLFAAVSLPSIGLGRGTWDVLPRAKTGAKCCVHSPREVEQGCLVHLIFSGEDPHLSSSFKQRRKIASQ